MAPDDYLSAFPQLQEQQRSLYEQDILAQQEALKQKIASEAALKEAAYQNPQRTLAQALTQAFAGAIPSLAGALVGGQRGAGYGFQAGGQGAESLGLHYDTEDKENKQLAQSEFANAIRDRQTQENQIELLKQRKNEALLNLGIHGANEAGEETRSKRSHEEMIRYHNLLDQERKDANAALAAKEEEKKNQISVFATQQIMNGRNNLESLPNHVQILPGATVKDKDIKEVREGIDALDKGNVYERGADQFIDKYGGVSIEDLPQQADFKGDLQRLRSLYMQLDPNNPLYRQGLTESERGLIYGQLGPMAVNLDVKSIGGLLATAKDTKASVARDMATRRELASKYLENRHFKLLPETTDKAEIARREQERQRAIRSYEDHQRKGYLSIQRGGGTYGESVAEEDRPLTATEKMQALTEALGVK